MGQVFGSSRSQIFFKIGFLKKLITGNSQSHHYAELGN